VLSNVRGAFRATPIVLIDDLRVVSPPDGSGQDRSMTPAARATIAAPVVAPERDAHRSILSAIDAHVDTLATTTHAAARTAGERFETMRAIRASRRTGLRFMPVVDRVVPTYLAFGSAEQLTRYLHIRASLSAPRSDG
jgi:hypothetical protein